MDTYEVDANSDEYLDFEDSGREEMNMSNYRSHSYPS